MKERRREEGKRRRGNEAVGLGWRMSR